jgi:hypothetical protein
MLFPFHYLDIYKIFSKLKTVFYKRCKCHYDSETNKAKHVFWYFD